MSFSRSPQSLGAALQAWIDERGLRQKLNQARAMEAWKTLALPQINAVTESLWMDRGRLFVKLNSSAWRAELHFQRGAWRDRLNAELGEPIVEEILFR